MKARYSFEYTDRLSRLIFIVMLKERKSIWRLSIDSPGLGSGRYSFEGGVYAYLEGNLFEYGSGDIVGEEGLTDDDISWLDEYSPLYFMREGNAFDWSGNKPPEMK